MHCFVDGELAAHLRDDGQHDAVDIRGRAPDEEPSYQETLEVEHGARDLLGARRSLITSVEQVQQQGIHRGRAPGVQAGEALAHVWIRLTRRIQHRREESPEPRQSLDLCLDVALLHEPVDACLLRGVGVGLLDSRIPLDEVQPEQQLQVVCAQRLLQRKPQAVVDSVTARGQAHEQVVAQEVALR
jgi:hypothetical protein